MRALRILLWIAAGLLTSGGLALPLLSEPSLGSLEGRLIARDSGRPVAAEVRLLGAPDLQTRSDSHGRFSCRRIPSGWYVLEASSPGHTASRVPVEVAEGKTSQVKVEMIRRPSWLRLVLHDHIIYPGEPVSIAVRGLTLRPSYQLETYRINRRARVKEWEAREYSKALAAGLQAEDLTALSSRQVTPDHLDSEGSFYHRLNLDRLPVGRYLVAATGETGSRSVEGFTISRLSLLVKSDREQAAAYVADLKSGTPIAGATVRGGGASAVTGADGLARLDLKQAPGGDSITYTAQAGADTVSLDQWRGEAGAEPYALFCFTDRPIYRPGDRVQFKGVLRQREGTGYRLPDRTEIKFTVTDEDGSQVYQSRFSTNGQGSFAGGFDLPKEARAGSYTMTSTIGSFEDESFLTVASYLKPELELSARPVKKHYMRGELATVEVQAVYYFGAPAADLKLHWSLSRASYYPPSEEDEDYSGEEGDYEGDTYGGEMVSEGDAVTDEAGKVTLRLPTRLPSSEEQREEEDPYADDLFTLDIYTTSEAGGSAQASAAYLATRGLFSLAAAPEKYVLTPRQPTGVRIEAADFEGRPVANQPISLQLLREIRPAARGKIKRVVLASWAARTGPDGVAHTSVSVPKEGEFVLEAASRDSQGRPIAVRQWLWASGEGYWEFGEGQTEITIVADRKSYQENDRARLLVTSRRPGAALFCLEGDRLYDARPLILRRGANLVEVQLKPEHLPNVYAWIGQVYHKRLHQASKQLKISRESRQLTVQVKPDRQEYRPGDAATCQVRVTGADGRPAQAEVALGVVDEAIYALAGDNVLDPAVYFYQRRHNRVSTGFAPESSYLGGADKAPSEIQVRRRFLDTAFWAPQVLTGPDGRAQVTFKLPDNLTSWRATARAVSADTRGGVGRVNFKVNKPLMVRLDLPRFATQGDRFRVSAYVHNETDAAQQVTLSPWARGVKLEAAREQLTIAPRRMVRRDWWATVSSPEKAVFGASAVSGGLNDAVELALPVNPFARVQFDAWSGDTTGRTSLSIPLRDDAFADRARLTVAVSPSIASSLLSSLDYLASYPYGCVEQTVSSFLPDLYLLHLLNARGLGGSPLAQKIPPMLASGLARLSQLRREEGGWGWGRWGQLDIWMTSYALLALDEARRAGYRTMDLAPAISRLEDALRTGRREYPDDLAFAGYVLSRLKSPLAVPTTVRAESSPQLSGRGLALCALAFFEQGNPTEAHRLVHRLWSAARPEGDWRYWAGDQDAQSRWWDGGASIEATAWALKAILRADPKDPRAASVVGWLMESRRGDHWISTRDTAVSLFALVDYLRLTREINPNYTAVVRLNGQQILRRTYSGQPNTWEEVEILVPAAKLHRGVNTLTFTIEGRGNPSPPSVAIHGRDAHATVGRGFHPPPSRGASLGQLYYRASLRQQVALEQEEKTASGRIFQLQREYFKLGRGGAAGGLSYGPAGSPRDSFAGGDRVLVRLTVTSSQRLRYVVIEDPLPAGLEPNARGDVGLMDWRSWWVDSDVRDDKVAFYLDWLPTGKQVIEYVLSARTPGQFHALPPSGFAMYQPKVNALGDQFSLEVSE